MGGNTIRMNIAAAKSREELVRMLAMLRLRSDSQATAQGITELSVMKFSDDELEALPESLISHIIDDYMIMKNNGVKEQEIFKSLDMQRTLQGKQTATINAKNLVDYIKQRLRIDFPRISSLDDKVIDMASLYTLYWYTKSSRSKEEWQKADSFASKVIGDIQQKQLQAKQAEEAEQAAAAEADAAEQVAEAEASSVEASKSRAWLIWLIVALLLAAGGYWLMFMGGLELISALLGN